MHSLVPVWAENKGRPEAMHLGMTMNDTCESHERGTRQCTYVCREGDLSYCRVQVDHVGGCLACMKMSIEPLEHNVCVH